MRTKRLLKCLPFREQDRDIITLGPGTRLNPLTNKAQLAYDSNLTPQAGGYPTSPDLYVKTQLTFPRSVRRWIGFEAVAQHAYIDNNINTPVTTLRFRLDNGTNEYFWNGSSWTIATSSDWNTEDEVAEHIAEWSVKTMSQHMRVVVNLRTGDSSVTPQLIGIKLLFEAAIEFQEDLIFRSFLPMLRNSIRPIGRHTFVVTSTSSVINLEQVKIETPYNFVGVDSVFNDTVDPEHFDDLFLTYDTGTKNIALASPISAGQRIFINFVYAPEVAVSTSQDYIKAEKVPSIVITDLRLVETAELQQDNYVANKVAGTAVVIPAPLQGDLEGTLIAMADKAVDNHRMWDEIKHFFSNNPFMVSTGLDDRYRLWLVDEYEDKTSPDQKELHSGEATFRIRNVRFWTKDAYDDYIVMSKPKTGVGSTIFLP